jgi:hypothetical protein
MHGCKTVNAAASPGKCKDIGNPDRHLEARSVDRPNLQSILQTRGSCTNLFTGWLHCLYSPGSRIPPTATLCKERMFRHTEGVLEPCPCPYAPDILLESVVKRLCSDPRLSAGGCCCWKAAKKELSARGGEVKVL